jgi:hypothetical protein
MSFADKLDELVTDHWNEGEAEEIVEALELKLHALIEQLREEDRRE